jgi:hypothetical protein
MYITLTKADGQTDIQKGVKHKLFSQLPDRYEPAAEKPTLRRHQLKLVTSRDFKESSSFEF